MSGSAEISTHVQANEPGVTASSGMKVALIGPNEAYRKIVAKALAGSEARAVREFVDYPRNLADLPSMLDQHYDVIMIDVDSDEAYAIKIVEAVAGITSAVVMVYSRRNDPDLLMTCMRAGARDFLPLPQEIQPEPSASGPQLVQPESHPEPRPEARPVPPPAPQTFSQPEPRPVPPAPQSFASPEPPAYVPAIERGVPEQRIDEFPLRPLADLAQPHSLQQDIDEWDNAHLRAPEPAINREAAPRAQFAAPAEAVPFRPEPATFRAPEPVRAPEPRIPEPANTSDDGQFALEAFLRNPEPAKPAASTPIDFLKVPEPPARPAVEPRRLESTPLPVQSKEEAKPADAPASFDDWDSAFLRTPQANKSTSGSLRPVTSIPRPQQADPAPAPAPVPVPAPREVPAATLFASIAEPAAAAAPVAPAPVAPAPVAPAPVAPAPIAEPSFDRTSRPVFQYEVPEEERQEKSKMGLILAIAGVIAVAACAAAFFILKPFHHNDAPAAAAQVQPQQAAQQTQEPVITTPQQQQTSPAPAAVKPSAATPIAGAPVSASAAPPQAVVNPVSAGMMNAQLSAPSRIRGEVKAPEAVEEAAPAGFTPASLDNSGANLAGFGSTKKVTILPGVHAISSGVAEGMLIRKIEPVYPKFAKDNRISGTVVLQATISKTGAIEGLQVVSGPQILGQAALSAVKYWKYRPYMLNDEPVDVQTTINVVFSLNNN